MIYINDHTDLLDIETALATVSRQRREQALKFAHESGRRLSLAVYLLLMEGLQKEYGIAEPPLFDYLEGGKPVIKGHPEIHFNFSHSGNVALCAIDSQPVGADVETSRKITPSLIAYTMNDMEQSQIASAPESLSAFLALWTKKEAVLKLTGEGIRNDLKSVLVNAVNIVFETKLTENYIYSIARYK
ncbi:MAG: 4'-phosphopantetheinyl transferase superfamily protein [Bacteroidales bacterium]|nr:4'-phosphopantetheinyl transferase superfamily protein [Bacteroidales bacterium]